MHILSPETDNCPSWISGRERMTVENILWSISTKECCRPRQGLNPRPPGLQSDGASNWATGRNSYSHFFFSKNISVCAIFNDQHFNGMLTNDIVSFEQLGSGVQEKLNSLNFKTSKMSKYLRVNTIEYNMFSLGNKKNTIFALFLPISISNPTRHLKGLGTIITVRL